MYKLFKEALFSMKSLNKIIEITLFLSLAVCPFSKSSKILFDEGRTQPIEEEVDAVLSG